MSDLRDGLADALHREAGRLSVIAEFECYCRRISTVDGTHDGPVDPRFDENGEAYDPADWGETAERPTGCEKAADAILADSAFREAFEKALAEAVRAWDDQFSDVAVRVVVDQMLPDLTADPVADQTGDEP